MQRQNVLQSVKLIPIQVNAKLHIAPEAITNAARG